MNWDAIGALAELVGAIGVIASLAYLASQIRQNTNAMRGTAHESSVARNTQYALAIGSSPQVSDLLARGHRSYESLSTAERLQYTHLIAAMLLGAEATSTSGETWKRPFGKDHARRCSRTPRLRASEPIGKKFALPTHRSSGQSSTPS